jgi:peptide/nickel transport system ATP-binding protein
MNAKNLLVLKNVSKKYIVGGFYSRKLINAVESVSFRIPFEPKITALVGESGSGKTTIAKMILGLIKPTSGKILYKNKDVFEIIKENELWYRREVQAIFQDPYEVYNPVYKVDRVLKNVIKKFQLAKNEDEAKELISNALESVGLRPSDVLGRYPHQLSGGERQRLMLARVLLIKPKLIIADEPVSMIDVSLKAIFLSQLKSLKDKHGISCIYITHDLITANYIADYAIILNYGRIVEMGDMDTILNEPLHPYTKMLFNSILLPDPKARKISRTKSLETVSMLELRPKMGCVFQRRCPKAMDICFKEQPDLIEVRKNNYVACWLYR